MAGTVTTQPLDEQKRTAKTLVGGSLAESVAAGGTIVLTLIALSNIIPDLLTPIAVLAMGAAFLVEGGAISMRFSSLLAETRRDRLDNAEVGLGVTSEFLGGVAGVVLGILSLLKLAPMILLPIAVIVYGMTLMLSSGTTVRLNALELEGTGETERFKKVAHEALKAAAGVELLLGLSSVILGIIALAGTRPETLTQVATLIVGISGFVTGAAITARMVSVFRRSV